MSLYGWGTNASRQLINQSAHMVPTPAQSVDKHLENQIPLQVACGYDHSMVLTESGDVYFYGSGKPNFSGRGTGMKVQGLDHETIVYIAAGAHSSYAVSNTGKVYHWGLIHEDVNPDAGVESAAASATSTEDTPSGALTGLAQDQTTVVSVDSEARQTSHANRQANRARQLREIVRDSTEQWMLPTGDAEREYYDELRSMGYAVEEAEERMQERGREYHGMIRMGCKRVPQPVPRLVPHLNGIRVVSVSAGYAHVMLVTDKGFLYGAGYNDRGQLGLGHRINTSTFKKVDFLSTKFVVEVTCGQQHTLCRAIDRTLVDGSVTVGSSTPCEVYAWGNGMLGQLGLGMKGTSKGRLFPTIIPFFQQHYPLGVVNVAAGANFSSVLVHTGEVFSFGHSEYNQHGIGNNAYRDYVDPYFFFVPRKVDVTDSTKVGPVRIRRVSCGLMFTVAVSEDGDVYSWGWNEGGALGHGMHSYSASPQRIEKFGQAGDRVHVAQVVCGAKHVMAIRQEAGAHWAQTYHSLLKELPYADLVITVDAQPSGKGQQETSFRCHRAIVAARCRYLRGVIDASSHEQSQDANASTSTTTTTTIAEEGGVVAPEVTTVHLSGSHFNAITVRALLGYFYHNRTAIVVHKRREFLLVAQELMLHDLENAIVADVTMDRSIANHTIGTYEANMQQLFGAQQYADVVFVVRKPTTHPDDHHDVAAASAPVDGGPEPAQTFDTAAYAECLFAHKFLVQRIPYFEALMESNFKDSTVYASLTTMDALRHSMKQALQVIDVTFLVNDGVAFQTFQQLLLYVYTGRLQVKDVTPTDETNTLPHRSAAASESSGGEALSLENAMVLLALSNRLGYNPLAQFCERRISLSIAFKEPEQVMQCHEFAQYYNLPRLEMQCLAVLRHLGYSVPTHGEDDTDGDDGSEAHCP